MFFFTLHSNQNSWISNIWKLKGNLPQIDDLFMSLERKKLHIFIIINRVESTFSVYYFYKKINLDTHHASKSFWSYYFNLLACEAFKELFIGQRGITKSMPEVKASYVFNSLLFPNQNMMFWGSSQKRHMFFWVAYWELA